MAAMIHPLRLLSAFVALAFSASAKDLTVAADGSGDFKTVQPAIDSLPSPNPEPVRILIKPGKYVEYLTLTKGKDHVTLVGLGAKPDDTILSFHYRAAEPRPPGFKGAGNSNAPRGAPPNIGTTGSSSTTVDANDFRAENLTFENTAGDNTGQAVALKTNGDRLVFLRCRFLGFQDTLYPAGGGRVYFKDCYVTGDTDFIFGNATAVFDHCTINATDAKTNYYTAANTAPATPYGYVFLDCKLTAGPDVGPGAVYLGRPWQWNAGSKSAVAFIRCQMGPHVNPVGWHSWGPNNDHPENNTRYAEFGSTDAQGQPLDVSHRVAWAPQLTAEQAAGYTVEKILAGRDQWNPTVLTATATRKSGSSRADTQRRGDAEKGSRKP